MCVHACVGRSKDSVQELVLSPPLVLGLKLRRHTWQKASLASVLVLNRPHRLLPVSTDETRSFHKGKLGGELGASEAWQ